MRRTLPISRSDAVPGSASRSTRKSRGEHSGQFGSGLRRVLAGDGDVVGAAELSATVGGPLVAAMVTGAGALPVHAESMATTSSARGATREARLKVNPRPSLGA